jgi:hypothetical protein
MPFAIKHRDDSKMLELLHTGVLDLGEMKASRRAVAAELERLGWKRVLVDVTACRIDASTTDHFVFCSTHCEELPLSTRLAVVYQPGVGLEGDAEFSTAVCTNRGTNAAYFTDLQEALAWLE